MITVDTREKRPLSQYWPEGSYIVATLKTGDYTNSDESILVEVKQIGDMVSCCGKNKNRFMREVMRGFDYFIILGCIEDIAPHLLRVKSKMTTQYIVHCLHDIHDNYGVQIIFADREDAASIVFEMLS